jgi:hypothetical protein
MRVMQNVKKNFIQAHYARAKNRKIKTVKTCKKTKRRRRRRKLV